MKKLIVAAGLLLSLAACQSRTDNDDVGTPNGDSITAQPDPNNGRVQTNDDEGNTPPDNKVPVPSDSIQQNRPDMSDTGMSNRNRKK